MIIDFHMHAFPDPLAPRALHKLTNNSGMFPSTDGTLSGTLAKMNEWGIDMGVILNIATRPGQEHTINQWAAQVNSHPRFVGFGSVHPDTPDALEELDRIKGLGLKGVKLHPDFQEFYIDDPKMDGIYQKISDLGLIVSFHAGFDHCSVLNRHADPLRFSRIMKRFPKMKIVAAHLGSFLCFDDTERLLVGEDIYIDISMTAREMDFKQFERIVQNHRPDRLLFGSDCPWHPASWEKAWLEQCDIPQTTRELIFSGNALKLLGMEPTPKV